MREAGGPSGALWDPERIIAMPPATLATEGAQMDYRDVLAIRSANVATKVTQVDQGDATEVSSAVPLSNSGCQGGT
jgi:hypothetical protein